MNNQITLRVYNRSAYPLPAYASQGASGMDLRAAISDPMVLKPHRVYRVPTGLYVECPPGYEIQIRARSGLALKHGITLVNGIGTIDADYRGEICVIMMNLLDEDYTITPGERIAQMVVAETVTATLTEVDTPDALSDTQRGAGGFGHSGRQ
ncbi:MAG: dUTP diphosphatase [Eubacteriaceae bacterium]|nr:dUTP diphosphatase [Eubacteriaceae bacterium]MBR0384511.1 dUTP diphosphatase [Eubacteriaceae bacterium]